MRVKVDEIREKSGLALRAHGAGQMQADAVADAVAHAEAHRNVICGLYYLESYCLQLDSGRVDGRAIPDVSRPRPASIMSDAGYGFAQPAFSAAIDMAIDAARENGVATLAVAHAHTCTSLGYFTEKIARRGMIGIGATNASAIVSPPGGSGAVIGTNPIAMSVPGADAPALHFDFSTSAVALGKITMAKAAGEKIPEGWAVDADGRPTTDPAAALEGSLVSAGGYKGWGMGLMVELLAAGMTGSVNSLDVSGLKARDGKPHDLGQFYIILDPSTHHSAFSDRLRRIADAVAEQDGARLPGATRRAREEVDVPDALWAQTLALTKA